MNGGRRDEIVRLATRALKALRASSVALRPRCARLTALTARAATRVLATIDGPQRKCLTMVGGSVTVGLSSPAVVGSPLPHRPMWSTFGSAVSDPGSLPLLKPLPGCPFVRRHVRGTDNRIGLRFGPRPGADPTVHQTSNHHAATAIRLSEVDTSGDALSAPIHREQQRHRRSEWAGVSWPKDDDHQRDAAGGIGFALVQGTSDVASTPRTTRFARSFAPWRGRPHASASSWR